MTNEQILEQQVEALEKLLQLRSAIIEDLEHKVSNLQQELANKSLTWPNTINVPSVPWNPAPWIGGGGGTITISNTCPDGTPHQYPTMWGGTGPISCQKCGAMISSNIGITSTTLTTAGLAGQGSQQCGANTAPFNINGTPVHTTGYMQPASTNLTSKNNVFSLNGLTKQINV